MKSHRKALFWSFEASFLKEVSQKGFVFELHSFVFEGFLAEKLRFRASKLHLWRKFRRKAWFLSLEASVFHFEGSLAEKLRFRALKVHVIYLSSCLSTYLCIYLFYLSMYQPTYWSIYLILSIYLFFLIYLSLFLSISLFLSRYLSISSGQLAPRPPL